MNTTTIKNSSFLLILLFCSCSDVSNTAEVPEMAPAVVMQKSQKALIEKQPEPPAKLLLQSKELFSSKKTETPKFTGDSLLGSQDSLQLLDTGEALTFEKTDFSQEISR